MHIYTKKLKTEWITDGQLTKTIFTDIREAHSVGNWISPYQHLGIILT